MTEEQIKKRDDLLKQIRTMDQDSLGNIFDAINMLTQIEHHAARIDPNCQAIAFMATNVVDNIDKSLIAMSNITRDAIAKANEKHDICRIINSLTILAKMMNDKKSIVERNIEQLNAYYGMTIPPE